MAKNARLPSPIRIGKSYYAKRRVPKDLRPFFEGEFVSKTLGTADKVVAAQRFPAINAGIDKQFEGMRRSLGHWPDDPSVRKQALTDLVTRFFAELEPIQAKSLVFGFNQAAGENGLFDERFEQWPAEKRAAFEQCLLNDLAVLAGRGPLPVPVSIELRQILDRRLRDELERLCRPIGCEPGVRKHTPKRRELDLIIRLPGLKDLWAEKRKPAAKTSNELDAIIADFENVYGAIPAAEVTAADLDDFRERLRTLPRDMTKRERALPFVEREKLSCPERKTVTPQTVGKKITLLKALLSYGKAEAILPENRGSRVKTGPKHEVGKRDQFTQEEISTIYSLDFLTEPSRWTYDRSVSDVTLAWLMLLGLTAGPRLTETGQAELCDVVRDGTACGLIVTPDSEEAEPSAEAMPPTDTGKSVKTPDSCRIMVVSHLLIRLGFLDYVAALRRAGVSHLFPDLWVNGSVTTKEASKILNRRIDIVAPRRKVCFHSLRHTWIAEATEAGMQERMLRQLSGHRPRDESEKYGRAFLKTMAKSHRRLGFEMVDWDKLESAWSNLDWDKVVARLMNRNKAI